jgi:repressor LexA
MHQLSQKQLAALIDTTQSAIYRYETGNSEPPIKTMLWYADYFDVSMDYIYGRTDNPQGKLYKYDPQMFKEKMKDEKEWAQFVEMCFDPNSPMSARLKETMMQMIGGNEK